MCHHQSCIRLSIVDTTDTAKCVSLSLAHCYSSNAARDSVRHSWLLHESTILGLFTEWDTYNEQRVESFETSRKLCPQGE